MQHTPPLRSRARAGIPVPDRALHAGLFLTTMALLMQELLDSRLLSVVTAYHLSFLAISTAMLGGAAGAVFVFLRGPALEGEQARQALPGWAMAFSVAIAITQLSLLRVQVKTKLQIDLEVFQGLGLVTALLTIPFFLAGVTVTLALTRVGGRIGTLYAFDLLGAAVGCLLVVPVLTHADMGTGMLLSATAAAGGAVCFQRAFRPRSHPLPHLLLAALAVASLASGLWGSPVELAYVRGRPLEREYVAREVWNPHSHVVVHTPMSMPSFVWGRGEQPERDSILMFIDGDAATPITRWDGDLASLAWLETDVTALVHQLNPGGEVAVIGVGGGRDVLAALMGRARAITAIEINGTFIDVLTGSHREIANLADRPEVKLVHDEARAYLARHPERYDILEMSLVDTWASTAAGAFTLTENALYTREAWVLFLERLRPGGIFSTSRWFAPRNVSETNRLVGLAVSALLELGVAHPARHIALAASGPVASLLVSRTPLSPDTLATLAEVCAARDFRLLLAPGRPVGPDAVHLSRIANARSQRQLQEALDDPHFDYRPPRDERPYFFNMLKPTALWALLFPDGSRVVPRTAGVMWGNIRATGTLAVLSGIATALVLVLVLLPLFRVGLPDMRAPVFGAALAYFAILGAGFMFVQVALLQRFSVYLGHPIYSYVVILFTMILAAGLGSFASERVAATASAGGSGPRWPFWLGPGIAGLALTLSLALPTLFARTQAMSLGLRCALVVATVAPLAGLMGCCFPLGMRVLDRLSAQAKPWMWGVNGAVGVLASIAAVMVSMFVGIGATLQVAAALYATLCPLSLYLLRNTQKRTIAREF